MNRLLSEAAGDGTRYMRAHDRDWSGRKIGTRIKAILGTDNTVIS